MLDALAVLYGTLRQLTTVLPFLAAGMALEAIRRRTPPSTVRVNLWVTAIYYLAGTTIALALVLATVRVVIALPGAGVIRFHMSAEPSVLELVGYASVWLLASDFFTYWVHRIEHTVGWLWAIHAIHHADTHVNVTTAHRAHWLEAPIMSLTIMVPLSYLIAAPPILVGTIAVLSNMMAHFVHLDLPISLGRWNWLVATPITHRLHHSTDPAHLDKNFATMFPIWDVLFGTYHAPTTDPIVTGLIAGEPIATVHDSVWSPFRQWRAMWH